MRRSFLGGNQRFTPTLRCVRGLRITTVWFTLLRKNRAEISRPSSHLPLSSSSWALWDGISRDYAFNTALPIVRPVRAIGNMNSTVSNFELSAKNHHLFLKKAVRGNPAPLDVVVRRRRRRRIIDLRACGL